MDKTVEWTARLRVRYADGTDSGTARPRATNAALTKATTQETAPSKRARFL